MTELHAIADDRHGRRYRLATESADLVAWLGALRAEGWTIIRAWTAPGPSWDGLQPPGVP